MTTFTGTVLPNDHTLFGNMDLGSYEVFTGNNLFYANSVSSLNEPLGSGATAIPSTVTIVTSLPPATASTPVVITVTPGGVLPLRRCWLDVHFPGIVGDEVVHNSSRFGAFYTGNTNTRVTLPGGGYQFTILRDGGWPVGSFPLVSSFDVYAVDTGGTSN